MSELFAIPGWGVVFAAWALSAGVGVLVIAVATAMSLRGRAKRKGPSGTGRP
ncbi:hypothetical protein [Glycomyces tarimensis]